MYRYIGDEILEPASATENYLLRQDYSNRGLWEQVNLSQQTAGAAAFITGSDISAAGDLIVHRMERNDRGCGLEWICSPRAVLSVRL